MAWNLLAKHYPAPLMMLAADDMIFETPGWDEMFLEAYEKQNLCCIVTQDGRGEKSWPHYTVSEEWVEALGYFAPPWFLHWCVDTWTTDLARKAGLLVHLSNVMVRHEKARDATFQRIRALSDSFGASRTDCKEAE
jgi:hypothetical protein